MVLRLPSEDVGLFEVQIERWNFGSHVKDVRVEFIFNVPTTWAPEENLKLLLRKAGLGSEMHYSVNIGLTEA